MGWCADTVFAIELWALVRDELRSAHHETNPLEEASRLHQSHAMCGMGSWNIRLPVEDVGFAVDVPSEVLVAAEVFQIAFVIACICAAIFVALWLRDVWLDAKTRVRDILVNAVRAPASHRLLTSEQLWRSKLGALFREAGRGALARMTHTDGVAGLELLRRALVVEDLVRGRSSWLQFATPRAEVRVWVDVYLDSAVPRLERLPFNDGQHQ